MILLGQEAETFSLEQIQLDSLYLDSTPLARRTNGTPFAVFRDDDGDGLMDLILQFSVPALRSSGSITPGANQLTLFGTLDDGRRLQAVINIQINN